MLVVVSDLHLQHTGNDVIRFRGEDGKRFESGVARNVSAGALQLLFAEICESAEACEATSLELVFAGDIFEIHRTPLWFAFGPEVRPTAEDPASDEALRKAVELIVTKIARENAAFFATLRRFVTEKTFVRSGKVSRIPGEIPVTVRFVPGNHDRLVDAWPSVRRHVRELLCMDDADVEARFPHVLDYPDAAPNAGLRSSPEREYGVRIRHGHEYDATNSVFKDVPPPDSTDYLRPCLGDYVTVDLAARLATAFRVRHAAKLRQDSPAGAALRRLYAALTEFDDVRPSGLLLRYLTSQLGGATARHEAEMFAALRPVLRDAYEAARTSPFFVKEAARLGFDRYFQGPLASAIEVALKHLSAETLARVVDMLPSSASVSVRKPASSYAAAEMKKAAPGAFSLVLAGHTHEPATVSIPSARSTAHDDPHEPRHDPSRGASPGPNQPAFFIDTGTWRTRVEAGEEESFGRMRSYTMVFCYSATERQRSSDARRFESWTGHLAADSYGPYTRVLESASSPATIDSSARPSVDGGDAEERADRQSDEAATAAGAAQCVRFTACQIVRIDEGASDDGAELRLHFGVDDASLTLSRDGVRDGQTLELGDSFVVPADATLDGEVWCWGFEADRGPDSFVDADDPLPWGVDYLPRISTAGADADSAFVSGERAMRLLSSDADIVLRFVVV